MLIRFGVALLASAASLAGAADDWAGSDWIAVDGGGSSVFVRQLDLGGDVASAHWTVTALGVFEASVNGTRIGTDFLKPGFDHVRKTRHSFTYDVMPLLTADGRTRLSATVASGWWSDAIVRHAGRDAAFRAVLEVRRKDGSVRRFGTDGSWQGATDGPVRRAGIYEGEVYDARKVASAFGPVRVSNEFQGKIVPMEGPTIRMREDLLLKPCSAYAWKGVTGAADDRFGTVVRVRDGWSELEPGETLVVDFGQNAAAVPRFVAQAACGTELTIEPAEALNESDGLKSRGNDGPEGSAYRENLRALKADGAKSVYVFAGEGEESYQPRFTFFGYRYLSLRATGRVSFLSLLSVPVTSVPAEAERSRIETGVPALNRFVSNVRWGMRSNFLSVPMDCPQRDERLGWTGDAQVFARAALYQADVGGFYGKWMRDMRDCQLPGGSFAAVAPLGTCGDVGGRFGYTDAGVIVPHAAWLMTGDRAIVDENWESMERYLDFVARDRFAGEESSKYQWADWLSYEKLETRSGQAFEPGTNETRVKPDAARLWRFLGGCYWIYDAQLMAEMAAGTGRDEAAAKYRKMEEEGRSAVRREFIEANGLLPEFMRDMQTPALFALRFGILPDQTAIDRTRTDLLENIRRCGTKLQTGFLGTSVLMDVLSDCADAADVAYSLLLQRENPSWLYSVDNGATTVWERWNGYMREKGFGPAYMNSFNHYAYGSVVAWMYSTMAGIRPDSAAPGFSHFFLSPKPDRRVGRVSAVHVCPHGEIRSVWKYGADGRWEWQVAVPTGTSATAVFPDGERRELPPGEHGFTRSDV